MLVLQLDDALDARLGVHPRVVFLDADAEHLFKVLALPVDLKGSGDGLEEPARALEDFHRPRHPAHGEKHRVDGV